MDNVKAWLYAGLRAGVQGLWSALLSAPTIGTLLAGLSAGQAEALRLALATALAGLLYGAVVAGIRWLETRTGSTFGARLARGVARAIMLGLSRYQPVYATSSSTTVPVSVNLATAESERGKTDYVRTVTGVLSEV